MFEKKIFMVIWSLSFRSTKQFFATFHQSFWYPRSRSDLDTIDKSYENFFEKLGISYPGLDDIDYMNWLRVVRNCSSSVNSEVPDVFYPDQANKTWSLLYARLRELHYLYACDEHKLNLQELENLGIYTGEKIPQFSKINNWLGTKTGFKLIPVGGMINARSFLYGLAYRVFFSTRYIRHISVPFYSPEPDVVHELMGHVPLFGNEEIAEFSQEIGKKSLGASEEDIAKLAKIYFYSIEFGIVGDKILGAGILGSCKEIFHVKKDKCEFIGWDTKKILSMDFTLSSYQPAYFKTKNFTEMKKSALKAFSLI
ncbi:unnamed protein product [Blepharisma stoltei]|uniref:phenylalanine 4-monooxygenase n=1 Tax=Blepharisma stoltei TaxID=1481888 RepID=A0AAU9K7C0_9CILI|nr:unnamed protein product [Blepharisma stoltei]